MQVVTFGCDIPVGLFAGSTCVSQSKVSFLDIKASFVFGNIEDLHGLIYFLPRFFFLLLDAIKKLSAKLASINSVDTRKATAKDKDQDAEDSSNKAVILSTSKNLSLACFSGRKALTEHRGELLGMCPYGIFPWQEKKKNSGFV